MAYSVYSYGSQYAETGQIGIYVGTREDNLAECLTVTAAELQDVAAGNLRPGELERAKENLEGRMLLSLESTSNRMTRLGKALVTDTEIVPVEEILRRIKAVQAGRDRRSGDRALRARGALGRRDRAARDEVPRRGRARQPGARGAMKVCLFGSRGQGRLGARPGPRAGRSRRRRRAVGRPCRLRRRRRLHASRRGAGERRGAASPPACRSSSARPASTRARSTRRRRPQASPAFTSRTSPCGAGLMMRFAEEAARVFPAAEIVELHADTKVDAPSGTAKATAERMGGGGSHPLRQAARPGRPPGGRLRRAGRDAHDPPRHELPRGVRPGCPPRARDRADAAPRPHRRARRRSARVLGVLEPAD